MSRFLLGIVIFAVVALNSSCRVSKAARKKIAASAVTIPIDSLNVDSANGASVAESSGLTNALFSIQQKLFDFQTFSGKAKMHYEGGGDKQEFTTHFRIKKDSVIWASITAVGGIVQVARLFITQDSFKMVNYLDKEAMILSIDDAEKILPARVDFTTLQNLIMGNILRAECLPVNSNELGGTLNLQTQDSTVVQYVCFNPADTTMRSLQLKATVGEGLIQYGNYMMTNKQKFPLTRIMNITNPGMSYFLDMDFTKAEFNVPVEFPFSVPKNYKMK